MFARFDENPAMTLQVIKETKRYGRTDGPTHGRRTDGQRENSIPPTNKVCGGYNYRCTINSMNICSVFMAENANGPWAELSDSMYQMPKKKKIPTYPTYRISD